MGGKRSFRKALLALVLPGLHTHLLPSQPAIHLGVSDLCPLATSISHCCMRTSCLKSQMEPINRTDSKAPCWARGSQRAVPGQLLPVTLAGVGEGLQTQNCGGGVSDPYLNKPSRRFSCSGKFVTPRPTLSSLLWPQDCCPQTSPDLPPEPWWVLIHHFQGAAGFVGGVILGL